MTAQFRGRNERGEWLVTVFPAEAGKPASAEAAFRPNEWDTWSPPVQLEAVPVREAVQ
jgi:hypothetical protein